MAVVRTRWPEFWDKLSLSKPQADFLASRKTLKLLNCGRFGGKSFLAIINLVHDCLRLYATYSADPTWWRLGPRVTAAIFAPQEETYEPLWTMLQSLVPQLPGKTAGRPNTNILQDAKRIELLGPLGIRIECISCWNDDAIRGAGFDVAFVDEAAQLKRESTFWRVIFPLCATRGGYAGRMIVASTPFDNFWDNWVQQARTASGDFRDWELHEWTSWENPRLTDVQRSLILATRENHYTNYAQEYLARLHVKHPTETISEAEQIWDERGIAPILATEHIESTGPYLVAVDLAWTGPDDCAVIVVDLPRRLVVHAEVHPKMDDAALLELFDRLNRQWNAPEFWFDRTGGRARVFASFIPAELRARHLIFRRSIDNVSKRNDLVTKDHLVTTLQQRINLRALRIPDPDLYPVTTLPWSGQQDQTANLRRLLREITGMRRVTIERRRGKNTEREYQYQAATAYDPATQRHRKTDDLFDALLIASHAMPALVTENASFEEFEQALLSNW